MIKPQFNTTPQYNLRVVMEETGIKADALRIWEKRYDLPKPERSEGGHRLYSEYDIATVQWLQNRLQEGLRISKAVKLFLEIEDEGKDPFVLYPDSDYFHQFLVSETINSSSLSKLRDLWIEACLTFNDQKSNQVMDQAFDNYPIETASVEILQKGLKQIGSLWYEGKASVQQEHFASEIATRKVHALISKAPKPVRDKSILIGCPVNELHTFYPLLINLLLRYRGWQVLNLGGNVPLDNLLSTLETTSPDLVIYSAMRLATASSLLDVAQFLETQRIPFGFGGWIFDQTEALRKVIPGFYFRSDLLESITIIERILNGSQSNNVTSKIADHSLALQDYLSNQLQIEIEVEKLLNSSNFKGSFPLASIRSIHTFFADDIIAGFKLGDLKHVNFDVTWIEGYLSNLKVDDQFLKFYFKLYTEACSLFLEEGNVLINWLETLC